MSSLQQWTGLTVKSVTCSLIPFLELLNVLEPSQKEIGVRTEMFAREK